MKKNQANIVDKRRNEVNNQRNNKTFCTEYKYQMVFKNIWAKDVKNTYCK